MTQVFLEVDKQASTSAARDSAAAIERMRGLSMPLGKSDSRIARIEPYANPAPKPWYDVVVLGGDPAGRHAAAAAAAGGAKVALVEPPRDPLWAPSGQPLIDPRVFLYALAKIAGDATAASRAKPFGVMGGEQVSVDFAAAMQHARNAAKMPAQADDARAFIAESGVELFIAEGRFVGPDSIDADSHRLRFGRAIIAVGASAAVLNIPGLAETPHYTDQTLHQLPGKPRTVAVLGHDAAACALAQTLARLGCAATLLTSSPRLMPDEDADAAELIRRALAADGVTIKLATPLTRVQREGMSCRLITGSEPAALSMEADAIIVSAGKRPDLSLLDLPLAGVRVAGGLVLDGYLRTTNKRVFACGDACLGFETDPKFSSAPAAHTFAGPGEYNAIAARAAEAGARLAGRNAISPIPKRIDMTVNPRLVLTQPQIAHVGFDQREAAASGIAPTVHRVNLSKFCGIDRNAQIDGYLKLWTRGKTGQILGATIVSDDAAEMIGALSTAMTHGISLAALQDVLPARPSRSQAIEFAAQHFGHAPGVKPKRPVPWLVLRR